MGVRVNPNRRTLKNIYRTYIDVICYVKSDKSRVNIKDSEAQQADEVAGENVDMHEVEKDHAIADPGLNTEHQTFADSEVRKFREFSKKSDLYELLIDSLAPSIWENTDVKKGILT